MSEVAGAVVATSLVLVAVFVPLTLLPGTTGILFRQFALSRRIFDCYFGDSTRSPSRPRFAAILLGREVGVKNWLFKRVDRVINGVTESSRRTLSGLLRFPAGCDDPFFFAALGHDLSGFPARTQRLRFRWGTRAISSSRCRHIQARRLKYTEGIRQQIQRILKDKPKMKGIFQISGFSFNGSAPNKTAYLFP